MGVRAMIFQAVIAFCIILCIIIAILIYYSELDFTLKLVSLPFSIFFLSAFIYWVSDNLGTPVEGTPIGEFKYIHHTMKGNETIYLWIYQKEDQKHRLYQFPYTRDAAKKLAKAGEDAKKGVEISGEMAEGPSGSGHQIRIELYPTRPNMIAGPVKN